MNLQENIFRIKQIMGVLNEQEKLPPCLYDDWENGDGKTKPKITIEKNDETGVKVVYEGPESGFCIARAEESNKDTIHQLANVANIITSRKLKELYDNGIYVKPNLSEIKMSKKDNYHDIDIPFIPTTEDKAITGFARRGSWGNLDDAKRQFNIKLNEIQGNQDFDLIEKTDKPIIATGGNSWDIIEYFLAFRDLKTYPIKSKPNPQPITPNPVIPNPQTTTPNPVIPNPQQTTNGGETTTNPQQTTNGGETTTNSQQTTNGGATSTTTQTTGEFKYPTIDQSFKPTNGDPWEYAYDGENLYVRNPKGSNKTFNLKDPDYFTKYPDSKLKTQEKLDKAIESIRNAYGNELGMQ